MWISFEARKKILLLILRPLLRWLKYGWPKKQKRGFECPKCTYQKLKKLASGPFELFIKFFFPFPLSLSKLTATGTKKNSVLFNGDTSSHPTYYDARIITNPGLSGSRWESRSSLTSWEAWKFTSTTFDTRLEQLPGLELHSTSMAVESLLLPSLLGDLLLGGRL